MQLGHFLPPIFLFNIPSLILQYQESYQERKKKIRENR